MNLTEKSLELEFQKFLTVAHLCKKETNQDVFMPSCIIDTYWHKRLNQEDYDAFCIQTIGKKVAHKENKGFGNIEWVRTYEKLYGKLAPSWFYDVDGAFIGKSYNDYLKSGVWKAAWDCSPGVES